MATFTIMFTEPSVAECVGLRRSSVWKFPRCTIYYYVLGLRATIKSSESTIHSIY